MEGYFRIPIGTSIIITILLENNHQVELFDTTFMIANKNIDGEIRKKTGTVLPVDTNSFFKNTFTQEELDKILIDRIKKVSPDLIAAGIVEDNYKYANHLFEIIKSYDKNIPVIVGGSTPTVVPQIIIENPYIDYLIQGEGEEPMKEICDLIDRNKSIHGVKNLWYKKNKTIKHNPVRPFINMDRLPMQNLDMWDEKHFYKPYCGKLYRTGYVEMSRGCPNKCTYCINPTCQVLLKNAGNYLRHKSIPNIIKEIKYLKNKHDLELIFFCDDNFLLMSFERLRDFGKHWKSEIDCPYWINTGVESINEERMRILQETGCIGLGIGTETGCEKLRKNMLNKNITNKQIEEAFKIIHSYNIRTTSNIMIGFPTETERDIRRTIQLHKKIKPKSIDINFVAPYIGTEIHRISEKMGIIDVQQEPGFRGMVNDITTRRHPMIKNPNMSEERLMELYYDISKQIYA